jgi:glycosyltransferase involved in cell wall biosynthesis
MYTFKMHKSRLYTPKLYKRKLHKHIVINKHINITEQSGIEQNGIEQNAIEQDIIKPKICVIMCSYFRKNGKTKEYLSRALRCLESQTYGNFKLFLIGDHYDNNDEFEELCKSYKNDIFYKNNEEHYRCYKFPNRYTYWTIGGALALKTGIEKAIEENFDYYLHLDDDDEWIDIHIEVVLNHIKHFPHADFLLTRSKYVDTFLPRTNEQNTFYNNYIPHGGDSVHASHVYKLPLLGNVVLDVINKNHILANKINNKERGFEDITIPPGDATILDNINSMVLTNKIKSLYIPIITVNKVSDQNSPC